MALHISHVVGFDDAPFERTWRGDVLLVGAVFSATRLDGVLSARVRRDGVNATRVVRNLVVNSRFFDQLQLVMLQGIAFAGFNVVNIEELYTTTGLPVMAVVRKAPDFAAIRKALLQRVPGGLRKWRLIEQAGTMDVVAGLHVQRRGITLAETDHVIRRFAVHGSLPEPLRTAHLIAGGVGRGESRHRP